MYTLESFFELAKAELFRSDEDKQHPFRTMILATQDSFPGLRIIVKRKITQELDLLAYTDSRSSKVKVLKERPLCSLLFYHPDKKLQLIIKTNARVLESGNLFDQHQAMATRYSRDYYALQPPGTIIAQPDYAFGDQAHFALLFFQPLGIQVLQLSDPRHFRADYSGSDKWKGKWLVP